MEAELFVIRAVSEVISIDSTQVRFWSRDGDGTSLNLVGSCQRNTNEQVHTSVLALKSPFRFCGITKVSRGFVDLGPKRARPRITRLPEFST